MKSKITKNLIFICLALIILITITVCFFQNKNLHNNNASTPAYLPTENLWKGASTPIQSITDNIHSVRFHGGWVVASMPNNNLIVSSPLPYNDPNSSYPDGLYTVNTTSGKVTALFHADADKNQEIENAAANQKWLVYDLVTYGSPGKWSLYAYNWATKKLYNIYSSPNGFGDIPETPSALNVEGDKCIWSNYFKENDTSNEIISEIHDYNLATQKDDILVRSSINLKSSQTSNDSNQYNYKRGIILAASVGGEKVVFSEQDRDITDISSAGDVYDIDLGTKQISHLVHLYHAAYPICSYGDQVVIYTNYNVNKNTAQYHDYHVYLYAKGDKSIYQLSQYGNADFPTQNERFIAWQGDPDKAQIYDLKTGIYYTVPGISTRITGDYVTWYNPQTGMLYWAQLHN